MENKKLVMIPGPTPVVSRILEAMSRETVAFGDPKFVEDYKNVVIDLKKMFDTSGECFAIAGSGTLAMEMAVANTVKPGDNILIVTHGFFGDRFIAMCEKRGLNVDVLSSKWGEVVPTEEIAEKLKTKNYQAMTVTHVDTSTGVRANLDEICELHRQYPDTMLIVDGVCAGGGERVYVDKMGIDIYITCSQKAFGLPPGLALLWAGEKAVERRENLNEIADSYIDFKRWAPIMNDPSKYWGTPPVNLIWALKEAVKIMEEEGIENRYERHEKVGKAMQKALEALGFSILSNPNNRAATLSNVLYMDGINDLEFRSQLAAEGVVVAGGLADYAGKMFRVGHMGNADVHIYVSTLAAIERTLEKLGQANKHGVAVKVFMDEMSK